MKRINEAAAVGIHSSGSFLWNLHGHAGYFQNGGNGLLGADGHHMDTVAQLLVLDNGFCVLTMQDGSSGSGKESCLSAL